MTQYQRVLIRAPARTFFYINLALALRRAFMRTGADCLTQVADLNEGAENALLQGYAPDLVFSINCPHPNQTAPAFRHVLWLQDNIFNGRDLRHTRFESKEDDLVYVVSQRLKNLVFPDNPDVGILHFATQPLEHGDEKAEIKTDFSLVGYIPSASLLSNQYSIGNGRQFSGQDYFNFLSAALGDEIDYPLELLDDIVEVFFNTLGSTTKELPPEALSIFKEEYIRAFNRFRLAETILQNGHSLHLYGPDTWKGWPHLTNHYQRELPGFRDLVRTFRTSAFNLHNGGMIIHPRVFDCMGAYGGPIFANRNIVTGEEMKDFIPGTHYIEYSLSNLKEVTNYYLFNPETEKIKKNAYDLIQEKHTWNHRVAQILNDLEKVS
ncbi:glycosyltransferase family protein [Azospira sp. I09]|uniref:glycosyltransferase family protein n=1 Tax=Azospira sp. I09 TaxID=1765049 RepID=UPI001261213C|nr:glycosyltransferase [Azospira sp. I09]